MMKPTNTLLFLCLLVSLTFSCNTTQNVSFKKFDLGQSLADQGYEKVQMTTLLSGHLHVNAFLNGVQGGFILDTGAGGTVIETKRGEKFSMKLKSSEELGTGAGGTDLVMQSSLDNTITFGGLTLDKFNLLLMDLDHVNGAFEQMGIETVDGVIGADILTAQDAIIDYSNLVLYLKK